MPRLAVFVFCVALTGATLIDFCNAVYACGCKSFWSGADEHCNIHHATGKHCPFCTHGGIGFVFTALLIFSAQAWISFRAPKWTWWQRLGGGLAAYPVLGGLGAALVGLSQGYWST